MRSKITPKERHRGDVSQILLTFSACKTTPPRDSKSKVTSSSVSPKSLLSYLSDPCRCCDVVFEKKEFQVCGQSRKQNFVEIKIISREWRGSTRIHYTITTRVCPHKKASEPKPCAASRLSGIRLKKVDGKSPWSPCSGAWRGALPFGYPWTKKVNLRLQPWTSRPRAQIVFVSRYRGPWRANARTLLIRTSALMSA